MSSSRHRRVADQIQKEISTLLVRGLKDPRVGFVTVTAVEVTPDLHLARVYYTVLGDEGVRRSSQAGLEHAVPYLRRELGRSLRMRYLPDLLFCYDGSLDYGTRIDSLLKELNVSHDDDPGRGDSE